nr:hypothetical protein GCM10020093_043630 [Planobispora longispora]
MQRWGDTAAHSRDETSRYVRTTRGKNVVFSQAGRSPGLLPGTSALPPASERFSVRGTLRAFLLSGTALATGVVLTALPAPAAAAPPGVPKGARKAIVLRIVDGDTIIARLTRGGPGVRVRFLGFDTPEAADAGTGPPPSAPPS